MYEGDSQECLEDAGECADAGRGLAFSLDALFGGSGGLTKTRSFDGCRREAADSEDVTREIGNSRFGCSFDVNPSPD